MAGGVCSFPQAGTETVASTSSSKSKALLSVPSSCILADIQTLFLSLHSPQLPRPFPNLPLLLTSARWETQERSVHSKIASLFHRSAPKYFVLWSLNAGAWKEVRGTCWSPWAECTSPALNDCTESKSDSGQGTKLIHQAMQRTAEANAVLPLRQMGRASCAGVTVAMLSSIEMLLLKKQPVPLHVSIPP